MNLATLITAIGQRMGLISAKDQAACRNFLKLRYDQLWRLFLWKDSLIEYVVTCDPTAAYVPSNNFLPTKGVLVLPPDIGKIIAVRHNTDKLNVQRPMLYYRVTQDAFSRTGTPMEFMVLSACVWEFDVAQTLFLASLNAVDSALNASVDLLQPDGVTVTRVAATLSQNPPSIGTSDLIDALIKPATDGVVDLTVVNPATASITISGAGTAAANGVYTFFGVGLGTVYKNPNNYSLVAQNLSQIDLTDNNDTVLYSYNGVWTATNGAAPPPGPITLDNIVSLPATTTSAPKRQRIKFMSKPAVSFTVRVLAKRVTPSFTDDSDEPAIPGMDGILFPLVAYDMAHRDEFSKIGASEAQLLLAEAVGPEFLSRGVPGGFLKTLISEEVDQAAWNSRILPENGFGGDDFEDVRPAKNA